MTHLLDLNQQLRDDNDNVSTYSDTVTKKRKDPKTKKMVEVQEQVETEITMAHLLKQALLTKQFVLKASKQRRRYNLFVELRGQEFYVFTRKEAKLIREVTHRAFDALTYGQVANWLDSTTEEFKLTD